MIFSASSAQRGPKLFLGKLSTAAKPQQNNKFVGSNLKEYEDYEDHYDYYDYYFGELPLPSGPTRRPALADKSQKPVEEPLPAGPNRELPIPSVPTRRPGHEETFLPKFRNTSPALNQFLNLPLLTTKRPNKIKVPEGIPRKKFAF